MPKRKIYNKTELTDFLKEYGNLIRKWDVPALARALGISRQSADYYINKKEKNETTNK